MTTKIGSPKPADAGEFPRDHNRPSRSDDAVREFQDTINQREGFAERITELVAAAERAHADDDETAGRCTDLVRLIRTAAKQVEADRDLTMRPYLDATRAVNDAAKRYADQLSAAAKLVTDKLNDFLTEQRKAAEKLRQEQEEARQAALAEAERVERERVARERAAAERARLAEQERLAAIEAGKPPPEPEPLPEPVREVEDVYIPPPPPAAPVRAQARGEYGGVAAQRSQWEVRVDNWPMAFKAVQTNQNVRTAVQKALDGLARGGVREIKGCEVYAVSSVMVR